MAQLGSFISEEAWPRFFDLFGGQSIEYPAVDLLDDPFHRVIDAGISRDVFYGLRKTVNVQAQEGLLGRVAHLVDQIMPHREDVARLYLPAGSGSQLLLANSKSSVLGLPEDLHGTPLGVAMVVDGGKITG